MLQTKMRRHDVEPMAWQIGPSVTCDSNAVEPTSVDRWNPCLGAGRPQRRPVEIRMGDSDTASQVGRDHAVQPGIVRLATHMLRTDAVEPRIERVEPVLRIDQALIGQNFPPPREADNANLADAGRSLVGGFDVHDDEIEVEIRDGWVRCQGKRQIGSWAKAKPSRQLIQQLRPPPARAHACGR